MSTSTGRWLAPMGASAAVLAVFVVPGMVLTVAGSGGPDPGHDPPVITPDPDIPHRHPQEGDRDRADVPEVEVVGYETSGRTLRLYYTVDQSSDCSSRIEAPRLRETAAAVVVWVDRRRSHAPDQVCSHLQLTSSVDVPLSRPLGRRVLRDAGRGGAPVPVEQRYVGQADLVTPPLSRAGR